MSGQQNPMKEERNKEVEKQFLKAYEEFSDTIFRHCLFKISDRELAKDITQDVFMKTWKYLSTGKNEVYNIKAFLYRVANNLVVDHYRKKKEVSLDVMVENGFVLSTDDEERLPNFLDGRNAAKVLEKIGAKYRDVIVMRYFEGLYPKEIALIINESENNVLVRINRGLKKARELLNIKNEP